MEAFDFKREEAGDCKLDEVVEEEDGDCVGTRAIVEVEFELEWDNEESALVVEGDLSERDKRANVACLTRSFLCSSISLLLMLLFPLSFASSRLFLIIIADELSWSELLNNECPSPFIIICIFE